MKARHLLFLAAPSALSITLVLGGCLSDPNGETEASPDAEPAPAQAAEIPTGPLPSSRPDASAPPPLPPPPPPACKLTGPPPVTEGDSLVWSDEFSGNVLDWKKWYVHDGYEGHGTILNSFAPSAVTVHDGVLDVALRAAPDGGTHPFVSGRIETFGRFSRTYGKIEFRARFPHAPGVWYAVWGRPATTAMPEIDVEVLGKNPAEAWFVNHWDVPPLPADERRSYVTVSTDVTQFHVYTILWKPSHLEWQLDGQTYMTSTAKGVPTSPVAWTINGWVGGWGATTTTPAVPVSFEIDYLRVYRVDGLIADPELRVLNPKLEYTKTGHVDLEPANFDEACFVVEVYDGSNLLATLREWPYRFSMSGLQLGQHDLSFVATDGVRSATTTLQLAVR